MSQQTPCKSIHLTEYQVRPVGAGADVYGVYDEAGRLSGAGSREACQYFVELLRSGRDHYEYTPEALAKLFDRWRAG